jgi:hypothetical protein
VVATSAGDVRVTGTCFRVEVQMKPSKSSLGGAAVGAVLAATVVVTVYEGGVIAASGGKEQPVAAGERVVLGEPAPEVAAAAQPPAPDATREELLARDTAQRETIQQLAARVAGLEKQLAGGGQIKVKGVEIGGGRDGLDDDGDGRPWFDPSPETLQAWVAECRLRFDSPPIDGSEPMQLGPQHVAELGLEASEVEVLNRAMREFHAEWRAELAAIYIEVTGDADGADSMSPSALAREIEDKAAPGEPQQVRERIVRERAGLEQPPADLSKLSPVERFVRAQVDLGNRFERFLAKHVGAERARELRVLTDGWGHKSEMAGCPSTDPR